MCLGENPFRRICIYLCVFQQSPQEMLESANGEVATEDSNLSAAADCDGGNSGDVESVEMTTPAADAGDKRGGGRGGEKAPPTSAEDTTQSPQHESTGAGGGGSMVEDDERGRCGTVGI